MSLVGQRAPDFFLKAVVGKGDFKDVALADYRDQWVILFFYPQDFTFVCPTEILEFSKREPDFKKLNAIVLGCSVDSEHAHKEWVTGKLGAITFPLLSDSNRETSRQYGALIESKGFATRATFIIDPKGMVQYALYHNDKVGRSVNETIRVLDALQTGDRCPVDWKRGEKTLGR